MWLELLYICVGITLAQQDCREDGQLDSSSPDRTDFRAPGEDGYADLVDVARFPIGHLDGEECKRLIAEYQARWNATGSVDLVGFIRSEVRDQMARETMDLPSFERQQWIPYMSPRAVRVNMSTLASTHPLRRQWQTHVRAVAGVLIPGSSLLRQIYESPTVARFFARIIGVRRLYQYDDEFQKLNVHYQLDGDERGWHYDGSDFVATLMLQQGSEGGEFEFAPFIRGASTGGQEEEPYDERFERVQELFDGTYTGEVLTSRVEAGTVNLFNGRRTLHRVRGVRGPRKRSIAILSYDTNPACEQSAPAAALNVESYGGQVEPLQTRLRERRREACGASLRPEFMGEL